MPQTITSHYFLAYYSDTYSKIIVFKLKSKKETLFFNIFVLKIEFYQQF